ncbi:MAG: PD-(D/E)XK nuclease family protein [Armatimonadota bacterium]
MPATWSASRTRTFQECRRKYYYRYHLAPLGRRPDAPPEAVQAERVKDLVGLEAWCGDLVHRVIETALQHWRARRTFTAEDGTRLAQRELSRQFRASHQFWQAHPEEFVHRPTLLDLHYYGDGTLPRERAAELKERVFTAVSGFLHSRLAERIQRALPGGWLPIDRLAAARLDEGLTIYVRPDFAYREGEWLHILDWKTGRSDPFWELVQVTCYALYAAEKWSQPLSCIVPQIVHLYPELRIAETEYTEASLHDVLTFIRESHGEIAELCGEEPLPPAERFPFCDDPGRCRWCQFRGLCAGAARAAAEGARG